MNEFGSAGYPDLRRIMQVEGFYRNTGVHAAGADR